MKITRTLALTGVAATALIAAQAHAAGFYLQEQSTRGTGRAYSGEVADTGAASLWWNPAAIASSPREVSVGASAIFVQSRATNAGSTITYPGGTTLPISGEPRAFNPIQDGVAPNFAIAAPINDKFAVGLSVTAPFNFTTEYRKNAWARYDGLESRLTTVDVQLTGAMKLNDMFDIGVGVDAQHTDAKLSGAYPNLSPLLPDAVSQLSGAGWDYGWTVGAQAHLDRLTLGASYRAAMDHKLDGKVFAGGLLGPLAGSNADISGKASFTTPWTATLGLRYRATDQLTLDAQVQRYGWSEFDAIKVTTVAGVQMLAQNYKDTTSGAVGADYAVNDRLTLRAGVQYDPTPTPDIGRTARVPDGNRWLYTVGATAQVTDRIQLDAAVAYIDFADVAINHDTVFYQGTPAATTTRLRGDVQGKGYILSLGARTRF